MIAARIAKRRGVTGESSTDGSVLGFFFEEFEAAIEPLFCESRGLETVAHPARLVTSAMPTHQHAAAVIPPHRPSGSPPAIDQRSVTREVLSARDGPDALIRRGARRVAKETRIDVLYRVGKTNRSRGLTGRGSRASWRGNRLGRRLRGATWS